jgi:regulator of RNase E activity RraB
MSDRWDFYFAKIDGDIASIFVNLSLEDEAPVARYTSLLVVRLTMREPRDDGLSSDEEYAALSVIDETLYGEVCEKANAIYAGRVTYAGLRDFYYYAVDAGAAGKAVVKAMHEVPDYKYEILSQTDAGWTTFKNFLLPSPRDRQRMGNRSAADQLRESGDPLTEAREIDHWAYFPAPAARDAFVSKAEAIGYKLRAATEPDPASDGTAFGAQIYRSDVPGNELFDAITAELAKLAQECGGSYDGWESPISVPEEPAA